VRVVAGRNVVCHLAEESTIAAYGLGGVAALEKGVPE
jgi:hypothetical protein